MKNFALVVLLALLGLAGFWAIRQQQRVAAVQEERSALLAQIGELQAQRAADAEQLVKITTDQERQRKDQAELAALRAETVRLRKQVKDFESSKAATKKSAAAGSAASPETATPSPPVQTFSARSRAVLPWNSAMVSGGWRTAEGKRSFMLIQSQAGDPSSPGQVVLRSRFVEMPEEAASQLGLGSLLSNDKELTAHMVFNAQQLAAFYEQLKQVPSTDVLKGPAIQASSGTAAEASITQAALNQDGQTYQLGPTVRVSPTVTPGGDAVDLTVDASLNLQTRPAGGTNH